MDTNLNSNKEYIDKSFNQLVTIGMILIVTICLPFYLLADNFQPLDCAFSCDTIVASATISTTTCNRTANSGVRLGFTLTTLIIVLIFSSVYFYHVQLAEINRKKLKSNIVIITGKETVVENFKFSIMLHVIIIMLFLRINYNQELLYIKLNDSIIMYRSAVRVI